MVNSRKCLMKVVQLIIQFSISKEINENIFGAFGALLIRLWFKSEVFLVCGSPPGPSNFRQLPEFRQFEVQTWTSRYYSKKLPFVIAVGGRGQDLKLNSDLELLEKEVNVEINLSISMVSI